MLTVVQYEEYKNKLAALQKEIVTLEAKQAQLEEHLKITYNYTIDEAKQELLRLETELPKMEAEFEQQYNDLMAKYGEQLKL